MVGGRLGYPWAGAVAGAVSAGGGGGIGYPSGPTASRSQQPIPPGL